MPYWMVPDCYGYSSWAFDPLPRQRQRSPQVLIRGKRGPLFYAQRMPSDLGSIGWVIDRKNREITQMEKMWATYVLPFGESWFAKNPHIRLKESNYSYFDERYTVQLATADGRVAANASLKAEIKRLGLRKTTKETGLDRKTIRAVLNGEKVKASTLAKLERVSVTTAGTNARL